MIAMPRHMIEERNRKVALENAALFRDLGRTAMNIADAIEDDDEILGPMASAGLLTILSAFPHDLRADMSDALSDEAARSLRADRLYIEEVAA